MATKNELLGRLKDEGFSTVIVNRIESLLEVYNDNLPQFVAATRGQLQAAYNKICPDGSKGLAKGTYDAFDRLVKLYKDSLASERQLAKETVAAQEAREAEKAAMRQELLDRVVDFDALTSAMAALGTLKLTSCSLGRLLDMYDLAKGGAK